MEVGTTFSTFLFGISTLQAFSIWALELGHAIAILHFFYTLSILQYGQDDFLQHKAPASLPVAALFDGILSFLVSGFFIRRVIKLTDNKLIASLCICLTTLRIMGLISLSVLGTLDTEVEFLEKRKWLVITSATIGAVGDVLIAGTLVHNLYHRKRDYFDSSENPR
ncbi:hypothetical protein ONZ45_g14202 [Pleurotus djamor]|nr:hypothetical protein ONZ45_g14202 [Pleurotus djamor]